MLGSSKYADRGSRPFYLMQSYDIIDTNLSNITEETFMKTLVSHQDTGVQTIFQYLYNDTKKYKKRKLDLPEQKSRLLQKKEDILE